MNTLNWQDPVEPPSELPSEPHPDDLEDDALFPIEWFYEDDE